MKTDRRWDRIRERYIELMVERETQTQERETPQKTANINCKKNSILSLSLEFCVERVIHTTQEKETRLEIKRDVCLYLTN